MHFLMKHETMTYIEAIRWLGKKYGIEIEEREQTKEEKEAQTTREGMLMANEYAMKTWEKDLYDSPEGRSIGLSYFRERGYQDETIRRYHLGYAKEDKKEFGRQAIAAGQNREYLLKTGLCYGDDPNRLPTCRFAGRVIFPYRSLSGKYVAFGGRILQRVDHAFQKYVNSPESEVYHKGDLLYGIFEAKGEMAKQDKAYIVEGYFDVLGMSQCGLQNTVASSGTALTSGQIRMIQRFTKNVTLMFDGDGPGIKAALKSIDLLLLEGMNVKLLLLPDGDDPDSFSRRYSAQEVKQYFDQHETDFITFKTNMLLRESGADPLKRAQVLQSIVQSIALIQDPLLSSIYVRQISQMLNVSEPAVMQALNNQRNTNYASQLRQMEIEQRRQIAREQMEEKRQMEGGEAGEAPQEETAVETAEPNAPTLPDPAQEHPPVQSLLSDRFERNIVRYIVRAGGEFFVESWTDANNNKYEQQWRVIDYIGTALYQDKLEFRHPLYRRMYKMALEASEDTSKPWDSVRFFRDRDSDPEAQRTAIDLLSDRYDALGIVEHNEELSLLVPRSIIEYKDSVVRMQLADLKQQLRQPGCDGAQIMQKMQDLNFVRKELVKQLGERIITG